MVRYRRNRVPDGTFFFTVTLRNRRDDALVRHIDALRASWRAARVQVPHEVVAAVVLPDYLHAVIAMRDGAGDYSRLWKAIKKGFTRRIASHGRPAAVAGAVLGAHFATTTICAHTWTTCTSIR